MNAELEKLAHLQDVEEQIAALTTQIAGYSQKISARETALKDTSRQLEINVQALAKEASARRGMELDTADLRQKGIRYEAQLEGVQSDGQMKALEHQITFCKQEVDRIDELEFASLMQAEALETQQRLLHETMVNQKLALDNQMADAQAGRQRDEQHKNELSAERKEMRTSVDAALLAEYDRISSGKKPAVAQVEKQRCSACQMMVRPQRWNEIREGAVHFCESCGRFLFYNPAVDLTDEIQLPPGQKKPAGPAKEASQAPASANGSDHSARED